MLKEFIKWIREEEDEDSNLSSTAEEKIVCRSKFRPCYRGREFAQYIINLGLEQGKAVSNLHLQYILYYMQRHWLGEYDEVLFADYVEAWSFGPCIPDVYYRNCGFGARTIVVQRDTSWEPLDEKERHEVEDMALSLMDMECFDLKSLVCYEGGVWKRYESQKVLRKELEISRAEIKEDYSLFRERILNDD